jgi:hypothetical protein
MAYFVILPNGDTGPSSIQVKEGLNSAGVTGVVGQFGSIPINADTEASMGATGLTSETSYDVYVVAENSIASLQASPEIVSITTTDITYPSWLDTPSPVSYGITGANFGVIINETGTAYFVVVPDGDTGPSSVQVKNGLNSAGITGLVGQFGNTSLISGITGILSATNLTPKTAYNIYVVAEDGKQNLQPVPVEIDVTTQGNPTITVQPSPQSLVEGETATFGVTATGDPAIVSYQWYNSVGSLVESSKYVGVNTSTLQITDLVIADTDTFYVVISNSILPDVESTHVQLTVSATPILKGIKNLSGSIGIYRFQLFFGSISFSNNHQNVIIPYTGYGNTALIADLTTYEYSLDGSSWHTMTAAVGTVVTGLNFTPTGGSFSFEWEIRTDIGNSIYNKNIYIRFQATSGTLQTAVMNNSANFQKVVVNETNARNTPKLPDDYSGISGSDLLANAPKIKK